MALKVEEEGAVSQGIQGTQPWKLERQEHSLP